MIVMLISVVMCAVVPKKRKHLLDMFTKNIICKENTSSNRLKYYESMNLKKNVFDFFCTVFGQSRQEVTLSNTSVFKIKYPTTTMALKTKKNSNNVKNND